MVGMFGVSAKIKWLKFILRTQVLLTYTRGYVPENGVQTENHVKRELFPYFVDFRLRAPENYI